MSRCKACDLDVVWKKRPDGPGGKMAWQCFNPDGSVHWDKCSQEKFKRIQRTGHRFEGTRQEGYLTDLKPSGVQLTLERAPIVRSPVRPTGKCRDCCPPWEVCAECPDKLQHHHQGEKHGQETKQAATSAQ